MDHSAHSLPDRIEDVAALEELLSRPTPGVIDAMRRLPGDIVLLGAGGKMGPTLARMARRASEVAGVSRRVIGVARFSRPGLREALEAEDVETVACDLLDPDRLAELPDAPNVVYMPALKFGATGQEPLAWAMNAYLPGTVCERYRGGRIVAFSTGNVYGLTPVARGGSVESDPLRPEGDYAMSCLGRERIFEHFGATLGLPVVLLRLNYAVEMRYGVLVDIASRVLAGEPVDLSMGHLNAIWQGDANAAALMALEYAAVPARPLNITGPELLSVRRLAEGFGALLGREARLVGEEAADALLSNAQAAHHLLGYPTVPIAQVVEWAADWLQRGGATLGKPTGFAVRDGRF
jgi:nucleoside-diphosphate-sugar epimerase